MNEGLYDTVLGTYGSLNDGRYYYSTGNGYYTITSTPISGYNNPLKYSNIYDCGCFTTFTHVDTIEDIFKNPQEKLKDTYYFSDNVDSNGKTLIHVTDVQKDDNDFDKSIVHIFECSDCCKYTDCFNELVREMPYDRFKAYLTAIKARLIAKESGENYINNMRLHNRNYHSIIIKCGTPFLKEALDKYSKDIHFPIHITSWWSNAPLTELADPNKFGVLRPDGYFTFLSMDRYNQYCDNHPKFAYNVEDFSLTRIDLLKIFLREMKFDIIEEYIHLTRCITNAMKTYNQMNVIIYLFKNVNAKPLDDIGLESIPSTIDDIYKEVFHNCSNTVSVVKGKGIRDYLIDKLFTSKIHVTIEPNETK